MPRRRVPDEASKLYLRVAYSLDRRSRKRDGTRLVPWDLDPVRLPPLRTWAELDEAYARLTKRTRELPSGFRKEWLRDHVPTLRALLALVKGHVPSLPAQVRYFYGLSHRPASEE